MSTPLNQPPSRGSHPIGDDETDRKKPWWLLLLLLLLVVVAVVVLLLLLSRCGGDDDSSSPTTGAGAASSDSSAPSPTSDASAPATSDASAPATPLTSSSASDGSGNGGSGSSGTGSLSAGGTSLLPLSQAAPNGSLVSYEGKAAKGRAVMVQSVPADEGFWVGTSEADRVWVQLIGKGESPYRVKEGDVVDFTGTVVPNATGFAGKVGVTGAEGADQLTSEKSHIAVQAGAVSLSAS